MRSSLVRGPAGLLCLLVCASLLAGCGGGGGSRKKDDAPIPISFIRIINAVADAPTLYLNLDDVLIGSAEFGNASAGYSRTQFGQLSIDLQSRPLNSDAVTLVAGTAVDLAADREVYLLVTGTFASPHVSIIDNARVVLETDSDGNEIPIDTLGVQFVQAANLGQSVDIYLTAVGASLTGVTPTATLGFSEVSTQVTLNAGSDYEIRVTPVGSTTPLYDSGQITLESARNQIFLLTDYFGPGSNELRINSIAAGVTSTLANADLPTELRLASFVANAPAMDLYLDDTDDAPEFSGVQFGDYTGFVTLGADTYAINITPPADPLTFLFEHNVTFLPGESKTLILTGDATVEDGISGLFIPDDKRPVATELRMRFVHAGREAGDVDVYLLEPGQSVDDVSPRLADFTYLTTNTFAIDTGSFDMLVTAAGDSATIIAGPVPVSLEVAAYTAVLAGGSTGGPPYHIDLHQDSAQ